MTWTGGSLARIARLGWQSFAAGNRRAVGHAVRSATLAWVLLGLWQFSGPAVWIGAPGLMLFQLIHTMNVVAICAVAAALFATTISAEREQETLDLLRLAGFGPLAVMVGKVGGELAVLAMLLLAQLPFVLLVVTLGGVATAQVFVTLAVLAAFAVFAAALGVCASVVFPSGRAAGGVTLAALAGFLYGPGAGIWYAPSATGAPGSVVELIELEVGLALALAGVAWLAFGRTDPGPRVAVRRSRGRSRTCPAVRAAAIGWKEREYLVGGTRGVIVRFLLHGLVVLIVVVEAGPGITGSAVGATIVGWAIAVGTLDAVFFAGRVLRAEIEGQTLPLLLILPVEPGEIVTAKLVRAGWIALPAACFVALGVLLAHDEPFVSWALFVYWAGMGWAAFAFTVRFSLRLARGSMLAGGAVGYALGIAGVIVVAAGPATEVAFLIVLAVAIIPLGFVALASTILRVSKRGAEL